VNRLASNTHLSSNPPLYGLVLTNGLSAVGDWLYLTALPIFVLSETGDLGLVGAVAAGRLLPWLLLSIPAGMVADRYPPARVLVVSQALRAVQMILMTGLCLAHAPLWMLLILALGAVVTGTFAMPAERRIVPELARDETELGHANAFSSALDNVAAIVGPAVAGLLILVGGIDFAFALNGVSFLIVVAALIVLVRSRGDGRTRQNVAPSAPKSGWTKIVRNAGRALVLDAAVSFGAGALSVLPVVVVVDQLRSDMALVGIISMATGIGGIAGAWVAAKAVNGRIRRSLLVGLFVSSAGLGIPAMGTAAVITVVALAASAAGVVLLDVLNTTTLQRLVHEEELGRTFGLLHTSASFWVMAGCVVPPVLAAHFGAPSAILLAATILLLLGSASFGGRGWRLEREVLYA